MASHRSDSDRAGRSGRTGRSRLVRFLLAVAGLLVVGGAVGAIAFYVAFLKDLPDLRGVADYRPRLASTVVDRHGKPIGEYFTERRRLTPLEAIPEHVVGAFVSGEDSTFYEHKGIDFQSILRAAWVNLLAGGEKRQGGSTITQQVVKGLLLTPERTYRRKIREMILARRIEERFTKQEILYLYLNQIYFGHGAYGIGEAARTYFDKEPSDLDVSEAALLAGLPKAPTRYSPFRNAKRAEERRQYVLGRMLIDGRIDQAAHDEAAATKPALVETPARARDFAAAAYFTEEVRRFLFEQLGGEAVLEGGLRIETTLDMTAQNGAVEAVEKGLIDLDHRQGYRGPLRKVAAGDIAAELERLAEENGVTERWEAWAAAESERMAQSPDSAEPVAEPTASEQARALLPDDAPALGVVTAVDAAANTATVGFAPDVSATVRLEDVTWARPENPDIKGKPVTKIGRVFRVGDVAPFVVLPPEAPDAEGPVEDPPLLVSLHQEPIVQGALLSFDVHTGDVLALVGGRDFEASEFNRVTQARRQPGSAFKPIVFGAALTMVNAEGNHRYTPASIVHDRPKVYTDRRSGFIWRPKNYGRKFYGPITLRKALAKSVNNAAVHLCDEVGVGRVIEFARQMGVRSPMEYSLALALGTNGVSLLEITQAYAVFANAGRRVEPRFITRVLDHDGEVLMENVPLRDPLTEEPAAEIDVAAEAEAGEEVAEEEPTPTEDTDQLIAPEDAYLMADMLKAVVTEGTGWRLRQLGRPLAGKTGTTNDQADAWFVGFSPTIATGVWVGHDEIHFLGTGETGSRAAAPIWVDYMRVALADRPKRDFQLPDSIVFARIDRETGLLASRNAKPADSVFQAFIAGTEPTESADRRRTTDRAMQDLREDSLGADALQLMKYDGF